MQRVKELAIEELIKRGYSAKEIDSLINPEPVMPEIMPAMMSGMMPEMISITEVIRTITYTAHRVISNK